jgi:diaminopimelate decarboxylase (EC 4.1.1.20)
MDYFNYRNDELFAEDIAVSDIVYKYGSPCYIYSRATLERHWKAFDRAFGEQAHLICYAVKANSNIAILNLLARLGSGFDIVSLGELERVITAGGDPQKIVFSGVGKREDEILAALKIGIRCFNIEVSGELDRINRLAGQLGVIAPVSFRVNPDVDAKTHPYISTGLKENKFGIDIQQALTEYRRAAAMPHISVIGIDCHIGSQLTETRPFWMRWIRFSIWSRRLKPKGLSCIIWIWAAAWVFVIKTNSRLNLPNIFKRFWPDWVKPTLKFYWNRAALSSAMPVFW